MIRKYIATLLVSTAGLASQNAIAAEDAAIDAGGAPGDEILVTGERVARTINETSSSIAVETAEQLEQRSIDNINQFLGALPNIQLGSGDQGPTIRGQDTTGPLQGADSFLGGTRPRTTVQIDGRAVGYNEFIYGMASLWDVDRVEVYRTPQTTTQGRNSIAGAIFIKTIDPSFTPEARVRGLVGNRNTRQFSAMVSAPLIDDQVAARATFDWRKKQSWSITPEIVPGLDQRGDNFTSARAKLLVKPKALPDLRLDLIYTHMETESPQGETVEPPFERRRNDTGGGGYWRTNIDAVTGILDYALGGRLKLTLTPNYSKTRIDRLAAPGDGVARVDTEEFTFEGIIAGELSETLDVVGGVYHLDTDQTEVIDLSAFIGFGDFTDEQKSFGLFGELAFEPVSDLTLTGGLRYQRDRQDRVGFLGTPAFGFSVDYNRSFDALLPKAAIAYKVAPDMTVGLLAQRAFNPGGTTISFETGLQDQFQAETLWNYEAFVRAGLSDNVQLNANLFYTDFRNAQRATTTVMTDPAGQPVFVTDVGNVPKARSFGAEVELAVKPVSTLSIRLGLGLLDTEISATPDPLDPIRGNDFARAPKFSASAAIDWQPVAGLRVDAQAKTNSRYFSDDANSAGLRIQGSTSVDAKISYEFGAFTAAAYVRNAFDDFALTTLFSPEFGTANDPRNYGVSLEVRF